MTPFKEYMDSIQHPACNDALGPPKGWDHFALPCAALPIKREVIQGMDTVATFWKPSAEELAMLKAGGSICLTVIGSTMAPVSLSVDQN